MGMFAAVAPALLGEVMGYDNYTVAGLVVFLLFMASTVGQILQERLPYKARLPLGCLILIAGTLLVTLSIGIASLVLMVAGAFIAGCGHGVAFRARMGEVTAASPPAQRAAVASSFFLVAYVAISVPVVGLGLLTTALDLATAGMIFSSLVALLALVAAIALIFTYRHLKPSTDTDLRAQ
jgi:MFS family permease